VEKENLPILEDKTLKIREKEEAISQKKEIGTNLELILTMRKVRM